MGATAIVNEYISILRERNLAAQNTTNEIKVMTKLRSVTNRCAAAQLKCVLTVTGVVCAYYVSSLSFLCTRFIRFQRITKADIASSKTAPLSYRRSTVLIPLPCKMMRRHSAVIAINIGTVIGILRYL